MPPQGSIAMLAKRPYGTPWDLLVRQELPEQAPLTREQMDAIARERGARETWLDRGMGTIGDLLSGLIDPTGPILEGQQAKDVGRAKKVGMTLGALAGVAPLAQIAYHGTANRYLKSILRRGLLANRAGRNWDQSAPGEVYFTDNFYDARMWAREASRRTGSVFEETPVVLKVNIPDDVIARALPDYSSNQFERISLDSDIPAKWIVGYSVRQPDGNWADTTIRRRKPK